MSYHHHHHSQKKKKKKRKERKSQTNHLLTFENTNDFAFSDADHLDQSIGTADSQQRIAGISAEPAAAQQRKGVCARGRLWIRLVHKVRQQIHVISKVFVVVN